MVGTFAIHLISILLWIVFSNPFADHGKLGVGSLLGRLNDCLVVCLAVLETNLLGASNPLKSELVEQSKVSQASNK